MEPMDARMRTTCRRKILQALGTGGKYTSAQLNTIAETGDARKRISELRENFEILDEWVVTARGNSRKVYYLSPDSLEKYRSNIVKS